MTSMHSIKTIDFGKELKELYTAKKKVEEVDAGRGVYLSVAGQGRARRRSVRTRH